MPRPWIAAFLLLSLTQCKDSANEELLMGKWRFEGIALEGKGGFVGTAFVNDAGKLEVIFKKNGSVLSFKDDQATKGTYRLIENGQVIVTSMPAEGVDTVRIVLLNHELLRVVTAENDTVIYKRFK